MTKKDFVEWADLLARYRVRCGKAVPDYLIPQDDAEAVRCVSRLKSDESWWRDEIIDILRSSNPRFDSQRFQTYVDDRVERIESGKQ